MKKVSLTTTLEGTTVTTRNKVWRFLVFLFSKFTPPFTLTSFLLIMHYFFFTALERSQRLMIKFVLWFSNHNNIKWCGRGSIRRIKRKVCAENGSAIGPSISFLWPKTSPSNEKNPLHHFSQSNFPFPFYFMRFPTLQNSKPPPLKNPMPIT